MSHSGWLLSSLLELLPVNSTIIHCAHSVSKLCMSASTTHLYICPTAWGNFRNRTPLNPRRFRSILASQTRSVLPSGIIYSGWYNIQDAISLSNPPFLPFSCVEKGSLCQLATYTVSLACVARSTSPPFLYTDVIGNMYNVYMSPPYVTRLYIYMFVGDTMVVSRVSMGSARRREYALPMARCGHVLNGLACPFCIIPAGA